MTNTGRKQILEILRICPDCRRVPLTRHKHFWSCPTCGGELWDGNWIPGMEGVINISIPELMQGDIPIKRRRTIRSGRRRRKPVKKKACGIGWTITTKEGVKW